MVDRQFFLGERVDTVKLKKPLKTNQNIGKSQFSIVMLVFGMVAVVCCSGQI